MLIGIVAIILMIRVPANEGRAVKLDLFSIYSDPFVVYAYVVSIPFFVALYKAFRLLGFIGRNSAFSIESVIAVKSIQYCAVVLCMCIIIAGAYIKIFHQQEDDPAGFLALCIALTFTCIIVATTASVFARILQNGLNLKLENGQLIEQSKK